MTSEAFPRTVRRRLGYLPGAIAVMGKWEPFLRAHRCLEEVAARAAAALAISEALEPPGPYLLSAEGHLRGQPRAGCLMAAEMLVDLGSRPERVRCCPAANQTSVEIRVLDRMRRELSAGGLLMLTAGYHVERTWHLLQQAGADLGPAIQVLPSDDALVLEALQRLPVARQRRLLPVIERGQRRGIGLAPVALNEMAARLGLLAPGVQQMVARLIRGGDSTASRHESVPMFQPDLGRPAEDPHPQQRE